LQGNPAGALTTGYSLHPNLPQPIPTAPAATVPAGAMYFALDGVSGVEGRDVGFALGGVSGVEGRDAERCLTV
jgi:hypothetical protein